MFILNVIIQCYFLTSSILSSPFTPSHHIHHVFNDVEGGQHSSCLISCHYSRDTTFLIDIILPQHSYKSPMYTCIMIDGLFFLCCLFDLFLVSWWKEILYLVCLTNEVWECDTVHESRKYKQFWIITYKLRNKIRLLAHKVLKIMFTIMHNKLTLYVITQHVYNIES